MGKMMAIKVNGRTANAVHVQEILTKFGCNIKTRVGFHEVNEDQCSMDGILILQLFGEDSEIKDMLVAMEGIEGVTAKMIEI